jgi:hypothetical protein
MEVKAKDKAKCLWRLEDWVRSLLDVPPETLDHRFAEGESAEKEILAIPFYSPSRWQFRQVPLPLLESLGAKIRGLECEPNIWWGLLAVVYHPLPDKVAHDLIDRDIHVEFLGHTRQSDAVQWRLADLVDEALLTIAKEIYSREEHGADELRAVLEKYPDHHWMLSSLAFSATSSPEKSVLLEKFLMRHADAEHLMEIKKTVGDTRKRIAANYTRDWQEVSTALSLGQLPGFYGTPEDLKSLASSAETPIEILEELMHIAKSPMAREIRRRANFNLRQQGFIVDEI